VASGRTGVWTSAAGLAVGAAVGWFLAPSTPETVTRIVSVPTPVPVPAPADSPAPSVAPPPTVPMTPAAADPVEVMALLQERDRTIRELKGENERLGHSVPRAELASRLESLSLDELTTLSFEARKEAQRRLLAPPEALAARYAPFLAWPDTGVARILLRGKYDHSIEKRGGGAYWSFATRDHDYNKEPDLEFQQESFHSGFYGSSEGFFLDLGDVPIEEVPEDAAQFPAGLSTEQQAQWTLLWSDTPIGPVDRWREFQDTAHGMKLSKRVAAVSGHTYVLRSVLPGEHDLLAAFRAVDMEFGGHNLVWRVLRKWDVPRRR